MSIPVEPSAWLYDFLKRYERFRPTAYLPTPDDVWTCGYGHTKGVTKDTTCTFDQADSWLKQDVNNAVREIDRNVIVPLTQWQLDALTSIIFNVGPGLPKIHDGIIWLANGLHSTLLRRLNERDYAGAADEFPKWKMQKGKVLPGLLARRLEEKLHFLGLDTPKAEPLVA